MFLQSVIWIVFFSLLCLLLNWFNEVKYINLSNLVYKVWLFPQPQIQTPHCCKLLHLYISFKEGHMIVFVNYNLIHIHTVRLHFCRSVLLLWMLISTQKVQQITNTMMLISFMLTVISTIDNVSLYSHAPGLQRIIIFIID